ncbi:MAG: cytochrome c-type biogenesis protein CcmH [Anaerolineales bacterium]|nr:cytochrome c-type biogenesis protein CcmH [Chloroflexota bacterium]MBL6979639.1 cytochrome c-type biogenesis protein CcmH [Anaerolineales bacterium]
MKRFFQFTLDNSHLTIRLALLVSIVFAAFVPSLVLAQDTDPIAPTDNEVNAIAKEMYCPVCENVPLDVCGTQACAQWRALIREKLNEGWTEDEIKQYFVDQYGARVLAEPPRQGLNWLVYVVPPIAFLAGAYILFRGVQSWRQIEPDDADVEEPTQDVEKPTDDYVARLEEELRRSEQ